MKKTLNHKRNNYIPVRKNIGFIAEGEFDGMFIQLLVENYFENRFNSKIITMSGKAPLASSSKIVMSSFHEMGIGHTFILFDTDNQDIETQVNYIKTPLRKVGYLDYATIVPIHPYIETWVLSGYMPMNEIQKMDLKTTIKKLRELGIRKNKLDNINYEIMLKNNPDFKKFINMIEAQIATSTTMID